MSYYVQSVYLVQSISIMNLSSLPLKTRVSSESRMSHNSLTAIATHTTAHFLRLLYTPLFQYDKNIM